MRGLRETVLICCVWVTRKCGHITHNHLTKILNLNLTAARYPCSVHLPDRSRVEIKQTKRELVSIKFSQFHVSCKVTGTV